LGGILAVHDHCSQISEGDCLIRLDNFRRATLGGARWAGSHLAALMECERAAPEDGEMLPSTGGSYIALDAEVHGAVA
jgi:hypothetical protein